MSFVSLVIPAFNESEIITQTVDCASDFLSRHFSSHEIIIVDDGSSDGTCERLAETDAVVVRFDRNRGKGAAVREGVMHARGDYIFFTDADLPYPLEFIVEAANLIACMPAEVVCGRRFGRYPLERRAASYMFNRMTSLLLGINVSDVQCGIKGFSRYAAQRIFPLCRTEGFAFDSEVLFLAERFGMGIASLGVPLSHRRASTVSLSNDGADMLAELLTIRRNYKAGAYERVKGYQG